MQNLSPAGASFLTKCKGHGGDRRAWMDHGAQMRVIIIQQIGRDCIDESRFHNAKPVALTKHCGAWLA